MGPNMKAFLVNIRSEPGQWTAPALAKDFGVSTSSARRTLRHMEAIGIIYREAGEPPVRGGRASYRYFPVESSPSSP